MNLVAALVGPATHDGTSIWLILAPYLTLVVAIIALGTAFYPQWKDHRKNQHQRARREERIDATCDAVLGCEADPLIGKLKQEGLVSKVTAIKLAVGPMNGTGRSLVQLNEDGVRATVELTKKFEDHLKADEREFKQLWLKIQERA